MTKNCRVSVQTDSCHVGMCPNRCTEEIARRVFLTFIEICKRGNSGINHVWVSRNGEPWLHFEAPRKTDSPFIQFWNEQNAIRRTWGTPELVWNEARELFSTL